MFRRFLFRVGIRPYRTQLEEREPTVVLEEEEEEKEEEEEEEECFLLSLSSSVPNFPSINISKI